MFRFTIRDLLWLTVVVALAVGWLVDHRLLKDEVKAIFGRYQSVATRYNEIYERTKDRTEYPVPAKRR
jgi:hypothetical protein